MAKCIHIPLLLSQVSYVATWSLWYGCHLVSDKQINNSTPLSDECKPQVQRCCHNLQKDGQQEGKP